jgi:hypothetical protein
VSGLRIKPGVLFWKNGLMRPLSNDKLHVKLPFKKEHLLNHVYWETPLFGCSFWCAEKGTGASQNPHSFRVEHSYTSTCRFVNRSSHFSYIFVSVTVRSSTADNRKSVHWTVRLLLRLRFHGSWYSATSRTCSVLPVVPLEQGFQNLVRIEQGFPKSWFL